MCVFVTGHVSCFQMIGGSVMVWGGITITVRTPLHIMQRRVTGQ